MSISSFTDLDLDDRILKAVSKLCWSTPSQVQAKTIPLAIEGKDIIVRAKTGSGKTGAYLIPVIQKILKRKKITKEKNGVSLVLVPSKELCKQAYRNALELTSYCSKEVRVMDIGNPTVQSVSSLVESADILISTPSKILAHINNNTITTRIKNSLEYLVIDEADVMFSYGYEHDLNVLVTHLPKIFQALLLSATISKDVDNLKGLVLHNPVILKLDENISDNNEQLTQYVVKCESSDKFLLTYALFKLSLVCGKTLIFVNSIDKCYRLKLFFEQFYIRTCVLNSELPQSSRLHIVDEFNRGVYDIVIATDEAIEVSTDASAPKQKKKKKATKVNNEYSVSRGIDFQDVDNVLNFDFPVSSDAYVHRIGRTARGNNTGTSLSFVASKEEQSYLLKVEKRLSADQVSDSKVLKPYNFKVDEIEGLRYRVTDAYNSITKLKIKDARLKEIKGEIFNSSKLKTYFEDNPKDLKVLRHDKVTAPTEQQPHMKNVPDYLVPNALKHVMLKPKRKRSRPIHLHDKKKHKRSDDPLKTFKYKKK